MNKVALITGITGQDGAYLAELLLAKGYAVHGIKRRTSLFNTDRVDHLFHEPHESRAAVHAASRRHDRREQPAADDRRDASRTRSTISPPRATSRSRSRSRSTRPTPTRSARSACSRRSASSACDRKTRFYQASTSELYGGLGASPQNETTPFHPRSPYGVAKLYAHWITVNYREAYGLFACNGILFNHESPIRGETFVTRKVTRALARIALGMQDCLYLGNLDARRDWGHARDYVEAHVADPPAARRRRTSSSPPASSGASATSSTLGRRDARHRDRLVGRAGKEEVGVVERPPATSGSARQASGRRSSASTRSTSARPRSTRSSATRARRARS